MNYNRLSFIICLLLISHVNYLSGQINEQLAIICDSIKTINDSSDPNYSQLQRSRSYDIRIENDSLLVYKWENDCYTKMDGTLDCRVDSMWHQIALKDIGEITYDCQMKGQDIFPYLEGRLEINALRYYDLVKRTYRDGTIRQTYYIPLMVVNFQDTVHFEALAKLLNEYIKPESNYIEPNCVEEELGLYSQQRKVKAIENTNLKEGITLNGSKDIEGELKKVLLPYLKEQNIPKIYGDIIIGDDDSYYHFICEQNNVFNYLKTLDTIPRPYELMRKTAYFEVTDDQRKYIEDIMAQQEWTSGYCNGKKVVSYAIFHVANEDHIKEEK